jgi:hypothetical protein
MLASVLVFVALLPPFVVVVSVEVVVFVPLVVEVCVSVPVVMVCVAVVRVSVPVVVVVVMVVVLEIVVTIVLVVDVVILCVMVVGQLAITQLSSLPSLQSGWPSHNQSSLMHFSAGSPGPPQSHILYPRQLKVVVVEVLDEVELVMEVSVVEVPVVVVLHSVNSFVTYALIVSTG